MVAAQLCQLAPFREVVSDGNRIDRLTPPVQVDDRVEDRLVHWPVEVGPAQSLDDLTDRILGQKHRAENALLGWQVLRGRMPQ